MSTYPARILAFQRLVLNDDACAAWLIRVRWSDVFACPECDHDKGWALRGNSHTFERAGRGRQMSVTTGTLLRASKLPLTIRFRATCLMATHSNGISALQLQKQLGIGSYRSVRWLTNTFRSAMADPERNPLSVQVEVDEASLPFRTTNDPPTGGRGRGHAGKMLIIGALELGDGNTPGRLRSAEIASYGTEDTGSFIETAASADATIKTDNWRGYARVPSDQHEVHVVGNTPAHLVFPWIHQAYSNLKGWARGVHHGLRNKHLQARLVIGHRSTTRQRAA